MKKFEDLTTKEIVALQEEELTAYCNFKLMEEGVIKPVQPVAPKHEPIDLQTKDYYSAKVNYTSVLFDTIQDAEKFISMNPRFADSLYDFPESCNMRAKDNYGGFVIEKVKCVIEDDITKYREVMKKRKEEIKQYEKDIKAYNDEHDIAQAIIDEIYEKYYDAQRVERRYDKIMATWNEYLTMCNDDPKVAIKFLEKIYGIIEIKEAFEWHSQVDFIPES